MMDASGSRAHNVSDRIRTADVQLQTETPVDFDGMLLPGHVLLGLRKCGFVSPSPIQLEAIPIGRCGFDMIVQAKSGTGKTCVFAVIALESVNVDCKNTQVLILAPTREIAAQIVQVIGSLSIGIPELRCHTFIGGLPIADDKIKLKRCHIAVGSPGRIKQLIEEGFLKTDAIRLFVLDEADKLLDSKFQESINWIYHKLPLSKQMLAMSATYPETLAQLLTKYMQSPTFVRLSATNPALLGIKQFYQLTSFHPLQQKTYENKLPELLSILSSLPFSQCFIFSNYQLRAQGLCDRLCSSGWPSVVISGRHDQGERLRAIEKLKKFECRIMVSTDLTARGIDAEHVNLVINLDVPWDAETYLHRIGRAGRYGSCGIAITLASEGEEQNLLKEIQQSANLDIVRLPGKVNNDLWSFQFTNCGGLESRANSISVPLHDSIKLIVELNKERAMTIAKDEERAGEEEIKQHEKEEEEEGGRGDREHTAEEDDDDDDKILIGATLIECLKAQRNLSLENDGLKLKMERQKRSSQMIENDNPVPCKSILDENGCEGKSETLLSKKVKEIQSNAGDRRTLESEGDEEKLRLAINRILAGEASKPKHYLCYDECEEDLARFVRSERSLDRTGLSREVSKLAIVAKNDCKSRLECDPVIFKYLESNRVEFFRKVAAKLTEHLESKGLDADESLKFLFGTSHCSERQRTRNGIESLAMHEMHKQAPDAKQFVLPGAKPKSASSESMSSFTAKELHRNHKIEDCDLVEHSSSYESDSETEHDTDSSTDNTHRESVPDTSQFQPEYNHSHCMSQADQWSIWYSSLKARKFQTFYTTYMKGMISKRF